MGDAVPQTPWDLPLLLSRMDAFCFTRNGTCRTIDLLARRIGHRLTIAATGTVRADVNARDIEIWGCLEGQLEAVNQVHIRKGARFVGEIHAAGLVIEEGGYIKGSIDLTRHPAHSHPAPNLNTSKVEPLRQLSEAVLKS